MTRTGQLYHVSKPSKMARTMTSQTVCLGSQRQEVPYSFSEGLTREASHHFWMHGKLYKHVNTPQHGSSNQEQPCCGVFLACS